MKVQDKQQQPINYLLNRENPETTTQHMYDKETAKHNDFSQVWGPQSHLLRRKLILKDHPELARILTPDKPWSIIIAVFLVSLNLSLAYLVKDSSWFVLLTTVYIFGGTINHTLHVLIHDFTHFSGHSNIMVNKTMAIFCNISMGLPSAHSFGNYHADHHNFMGQRQKDPDLPTDLQINFFQGTFLKLVFFIFLSPIYALRPFLFKHKPMNTAEIANFLVIVCTDLIMYKLWGGRALVYILISGVLSIGAHPAAIHAIAQHHQFVKGVQTYDYFGPWNFFNLNLGYHIQHHDFPTCPWYKLPIIRATAPEYYQHLPYHTSYFRFFWKFITDDKIDLHNRTIRFPQKKTI